MENTGSIGGNAWLTLIKPSQSPMVRLVCFPYAGGGPSVFWQWRDLMPSEAEIVAVHLPGRERRMGDELCSDFATAMRNIVVAVKQLKPLPTVYFGHSLGGLMAFETARQLEGQHAPPLKLVLSGCYPPHIDKSEGKPPAWKQDDAHFIEELKGLNGTPEEVLKSPELLELFLPLLRSDFQLVQEARASIRGRIKVSLAILGGCDDNITPDELQQWTDYTSESVSLQMFPGDHFFLNNHRSSVCSSVWSHIAEVLSAGVHPEGAFAQAVRV